MKQCGGSFIRLTAVNPLYWSHDGQSQQLRLPYGTVVSLEQNQQFTRTGKRGLQQLHTVITNYSTQNGNLILSWPKLLRPFKTFFSSYRCVYVRNHFRYKEIRLKKMF